MRTNLMARCNAISGNVGWGCWCVNFLKSYVTQERAANFALNSDRVQDQLPHDWKIGFFNLNSFNPNDWCR